MNWERMGNVRFAVICRPGEGEGAYAQERCRQIAGEWSAAMQAGRQGAVRDFVAVGDRGHQGHRGGQSGAGQPGARCVRSWNSSLPAPGIPPFLLGLSWSSTERMSAQQADLLTSEITALRRTLEPAVERICETVAAAPRLGRRCDGGLGRTSTCRTSWRRPERSCTWPKRKPSERRNGHEGSKRRPLGARGWSPQRRSWPSSTGRAGRS